MTTGPAWDLSNPLKPFALFDPDAVRVIPFDVSALLTSMGTTYQSHDVFAADPLECKNKGTHAAGVIPITMAVKAGANYTSGTKYPFTVRIVGADGQQDERTLWLKLQQR